MTSAPFNGTSCVPALLAFAGLRRGDSVDSLSTSYLPGILNRHRGSTFPFLRIPCRDACGIARYGWYLYPHIDGRGQSPSRMGRRWFVKPIPSLSSDRLAGQVLSESMPGKG